MDNCHNVPIRYLLSESISLFTFAICRSLRVWAFGVREREYLHTSHEKSSVLCNWLMKHITYSDDLVHVMRNRSGNDGKGGEVAGCANMWNILAGVSIYYPLSIGLTFFQKWFIKGYEFPLFVVTSHYAIKYLFAMFIRFFLEYRSGRRIRVPFKDQLQWLVPIGICASLDIGLSNWGLKYVTVSFFTMAKSSSILFMVTFALLLHLERWRPILAISAGLIAFGLFLFTWRSAMFEVRGLLLIELAAACTGLRWTVSQIVMQGDEKLLKHPLDMVVSVQPWMFVAILPLFFVYEGSQLSFDKITHYRNEYAPFYVLFFISSGGLLAFAMEMAEYLLLVYTSGITLNIFGIIKVNTVGLFLCFGGMVLHAFSKRRLLKDRTKSPVPDKRRLLMDVDL
uniref:Sugar phosphate transporter domain-containing protein n=1 Tax=Setaria digitata TaxID=48799 RepID=A0A915Q7W3_9BILA